MDGTTLAAWVGVCILSLISIGGWVGTWIHNGRSQARWAGKIEATLKGLADRVERVETRLDSIFERFSKSS